MYSVIITKRDAQKTPGFDTEKRMSHVILGVFIAFFRTISMIFQHLPQSQLLVEIVDPTGNI